MCQRPDRKTKRSATPASKSTARRRVYAKRTLADDSAETKPARKSGKISPASVVVDQLNEIQAGRGSGPVKVSPTSTVDVTNLGKVFFPKKKLTKGDLMRYYATVAPFVLPVMADRPLVLKRFPNGVTAPAFFQQNAGDPPDRSLLMR